MPNSNRASWPFLIGDEMILDPGMASGHPPWNFPAGVSNSAGKQVWASVANNAYVTNDGTPPEAFVQSGSYIYNFDISNHLGGNIAIAIGDVTGTSYGGNGTNLSEVLSGMDVMGVGFHILNTSGGTLQGLSLDNVSVKTYGQLGGAASWACGTDISYSSGGGVPDYLFFDTPAAGQKAELTGGSKTAFDAAVSNSTAFTLSLLGGDNISVGSMTGTVQVKAKGGAGVNFTFTGADGEIVTHTVTSGTGSGFEIISDGVTALGNIVLVLIPGLA